MIIYRLLRSLFSVLQDFYSFFFVMAFQIYLYLLTMSCFLLHHLEFPLHFKQNYSHSLHRKVTPLPCLIKIGLSSIDVFFPGLSIRSCAFSCILLNEGPIGEISLLLFADHHFSIHIEKNLVLWWFNAILFHHFHYVLYFISF